MSVISEEQTFTHYNSLIIHYQVDVDQHDIRQAERVIKMFLQSTQRRPAIILDLSDTVIDSDQQFREIVDSAMNASLGMSLKPRLMLASTQRELYKIYDNLADDVAEITFRPTIPRAHSSVAFVEMMTQTKSL